MISVSYLFEQDEYRSLQSTRINPDFVEPLVRNKLIQLKRKVLRKMLRKIEDQDVQQNVSKLMTTVAGVRN